MPDQRQPTRQQIAFALLDILDGVSAHEIRGNTGLPEDRCNQIHEIRQRLRTEFTGKWPSTGGDRGEVETK